MKHIQMKIGNDMRQACISNSVNFGWTAPYMVLTMSNLRLYPGGLET